MAELEAVRSQTSKTESKPVSQVMGKTPKEFSGVEDAIGINE